MWRKLQRLTLLDLMVDVLLGSLALAVLVPRFAAPCGLGFFLPRPRTDLVNRWEPRCPSKLFFRPSADGSIDWGIALYYTQ